MRTWDPRTGQPLEVRTGSGRTRPGDRRPDRNLEAWALTGALAEAGDTWFAGAYDGRIGVLAQSAKAIRWRFARRRWPPPPRCS